MAQFSRAEFEYEFDELEPHIDAETMEIHSTKHHQAYTDKLNTAVEGTEFEGMEIEELLTKIDEMPDGKQLVVRNNGGGFANHNLFFSTLSPEGGGEPSGDLADAINKSFSSFSKFKEEFSAAATSLFGSGWVFLVPDGGKLKILTKPNQDSPLMDGINPIMGLDVWEHAYYLNYQNRRPDYIEAFWNVIDWEKVGEMMG